MADPLPVPTLTPGARLGAYEIISPLGAGGMGEVFRAKDLKLGREVAIKVLPPAFASDADRLARFQREAQVLASLNHPNIAAIHGLEESGGTKALVLELVEGETLADRIARGPIPVDEALPIAKQIAEALEAAHDQGIIHRDLKPANIKVNPDGRVKVLDFGLAKLAESPAAASNPSLSMSPTITTPAMTQLGMILGTAAYMSPEQAKGRPADKKSDVWSFGCVLYEMLTGRQAFDGEDVADTLAFVLTKEPVWLALPVETPAAIHRLLRRCLAKPRNRRLPEVGSARLEIEEAHDNSSPVTLPHASHSSGTRSATFAVVLAVVAAMAALLTWMAMRGESATPQIARVLVGVEPGERLLSGYRGDPTVGGGRPSRTAMVFTPDGRSVVFSAERGGRVQLYFRRLDGLTATAIEGTDGASNPFMSPDGQWVGFYAAGALRKASLNGGAVIDICQMDAPALSDGTQRTMIYGATWSRANQIVFARQNGGLWQVSANGGVPSPLTKLDTSIGEYSHRLPHFLPDGRTVLFTVTKSTFPTWDDTNIATYSLATGKHRTLVEGGADARFIPTGHLIYMRQGTLMAVPFDVERAEVTGAGIGVLPNVMQAASIQPVQIDTGAGQFAVADTGSLLYVAGGMFPQDRWSLVWVDGRTGRAEPMPGIATGGYLAPRLSPDGTRIAFNSTTGDWDLLTYDVRRAIVTRLRMEGEQSIPLWTRDGSRVAFSSFARGVREIVVRSPDGSGALERVSRSTEGYPNAWAADGSLVFIAHRDLWILGPDLSAHPRKLIESPERDAQADFSPDGHWLAYASVPELEPSQVYVTPYPSLDRIEPISTKGGAGPAWRQDARELYYLESASADGRLNVRMMAVSITLTPRFSAGLPRMLFEGPYRSDGPFRPYDVTPDGQRFVMVREVQQPTAQVSHMILVQNWFEELKRLVPMN